MSNLKKYSNYEVLDWYDGPLSSYHKIGPDHYVCVLTGNNSYNTNIDDGSDWIYFMVKVDEAEYKAYCKEKNTNKRIKKWYNLLNKSGSYVKFQSEKMLEVVEECVIPTVENELPIL